MQDLYPSFDNIFRRPSKRAMLQTRISLQLYSIALLNIALYCAVWYCIIYMDNEASMMRKWCDYVVDDG